MVIIVIQVDLTEQLYLPYIFLYRKILSLEDTVAYNISLSLTQKQIMSSNFGVKNLFILFSTIRNTNLY